MSKLIFANFMRLRKDKVFFGSLIFMLAFGALLPIMKYMEMKQTDVIYNVYCGFGCVLFIGIIMAIFCSMFIGTEYSDGTIRNKVIVGQKRTCIYMANFITCAIVSAIMWIAFLVPHFCIGIPLFGLFNINIKIVLLFALTSFVLSIAFATIYNLISMINNNKAVTAVICILLSFLFLFIGAQSNKMLDEPKINNVVVITNKGQEYEEKPNPRYLNNKERKIVQFIYDFTPGGQVIQCMSWEATNLPYLPLYSFIITLLTTGIGVFCFNKKDLK